MGHGVDVDNLVLFGVRTMNTRKYPRSLSEAFPHTAEYGCSIEARRRRRTHWALGVAIVSLLCAAVVWL